MKFFTQWPADVVDANPTGWTQRNGGTFNIKHGSPAIQRKLMRFAAGSTNDLFAATYDAPDAIIGHGAAAEVCSVIDLSTSDNEIHYLYAICTSTLSGFFRLCIKETANILAIETRTGGGAINTVSTGAFVWDTAAKYFCVMRLEDSGDVAKAKVWKTTDPEPSTWNINVASAFAITPASSVGVGGSHSTLTTKVSEWNFLSYATAGETAPRPITNVAFQAWLDKPDVTREVLVEMSAVGFSPASASFTKNIPVYLSKNGYNSQYWDTPSSRYYRQAVVSVPSFSREMGTLLRGEVTLGVGDLVILNTNGERDDWLRMKWKRSIVRVLVGDPSWDQAWFRPFVVGRIAAQPVASSYTTLLFKISDLSDLVDAPIETTIIGAGPYINDAKPWVLGNVTNMDCLLKDYATATYQIAADNNLRSMTPTGAAPLISDNQTPLYTLGLSVVSVTPASDFFTTAVHGAAVNWVVIFDGGTPPAPLALNTMYFVQQVVSTVAVKLSTTRGGAAIDITGSTTGATLNMYAYELDQTIGTVRFASNPTRGIVSQASQYTGVTGVQQPTNMLLYVLQTRLGLPASYINQPKFEAAKVALEAIYGGAGQPSCGVYVPSKDNNGLKVMDKILTGMQMWGGWAPDGVMEVGVIGLPASTAVMSFVENNVIEGTLKLEKKMLPAKRASFLVGRIVAHYLLGPVSTVTINALGTDVVYASRPVAVAAGTPLDDRETEAVDYPPFDMPFYGSSHAAQARDALIALYGYQLGVFSFETRLSALTLGIGDTIQLTHSRFGWKSYTVADPASPDNGATFDGTKAVVVGIEVDLDAGRTRLTVFRRIPMLALEFAADLPLPVFKADLVDSITPTYGTGGTFTRATARTTFDNSGYVIEPPSTEAAFYGARRVGAASYSRLAASGASISFALLKGIVIEEASIELAVAPRDFTNAAWVKSASMQAFKDQTGEDNVVNSASRLKANGVANQTALQTLVAAAVNRVYTPSIKRIVGAGSIQLTQDGGASWNTIAAPSSLVYTRYELQQNRLNPQYGIRIVTSNDEIAVDWSGLRDGAFQVTRQNNGTRNKDQLSYPVAGNIPAHEFVIVLDWMPLANAMGTVYLWGSYLDANNNLLLYHDGTNLAFRKRVGGVSSTPTYVMAYTKLNTYRIAIRLSAIQGAHMYVNGVYKAFTSSVNTPVMGTTFEIGADGSGIAAGSHCFRMCRIFSGYINDEQMVDISQ